MNILFKRLFVIFRILLFVSFTVTLSSFFIFILDMKGSKGLVPIIFLSLFIFFCSIAILDFIHSVTHGSRRFAAYKSFNFILGSISLICFILSIFVFWI